MLAQCRQHGYFRGDACPLCDEKGRFLMKDHEIDRVGRMMAGILRHFPERFNLHMDGRGWVACRGVSIAGSSNTAEGALQARPARHGLP